MSRKIHLCGSYAPSLLRHGTLKNAHVHTHVLVYIRKITSVYVYVLLCVLVCPTGVCMPPQSAVPNNETASCLINVRGEEERCILGVVHQHPARGDAAAESPWRHSGKEMMSYTAGSVGS